jgi:hypothetical protein
MADSSEIFRAKPGRGNSGVFLQDPSEEVKQPVITGMKCRY